MSSSTSDDNTEPPPLRQSEIEQRIRNAKKNRQQQLKHWLQYDKTSEKDEMRRQKKGLPPSVTASHNKKVTFAQSLILLEAAASGDLDEVRRLLSIGVCPDVSNEDGLTSLHQCCIDNNPELCRILVQFGANVNSRDSEQWTPLHAAATCGHYEICRILISSGAELLALNSDGNMPYDLCEEEMTLDLIESEMASKGVSQDMIDQLRTLPERRMLTDMEDLVKRGGNVNQTDNQGAVPLHIAAACGYSDVARFLLNNQAQLDIMDKDGWQPIHLAACFGQLELIQIMVQFGGDFNAKTRSGETVFDICEDGEVNERLQELKVELERKQQQRVPKTRTLVRRKSSSNPRSASIRRSSMREKSLMSWKEAKQEAEMRAAAEHRLGTDPGTPAATSVGGGGQDGPTGRKADPAAVGPSDVHLEIAPPKPPVVPPKSTGDSDTTRRDSAFPFCLDYQPLTEEPDATAQAAEQKKPAANPPPLPPHTRQKQPAKATPAAVAVVEDSRGSRRSSDVPVLRGAAVAQPREDLTELSGNGHVAASVEPKILPVQPSGSVATIEKPIPAVRTTMPRSAQGPNVRRSGSNQNRTPQLITPRPDITTTDKERQYEGKCCVVM